MILHQAKRRWKMVQNDLKPCPFCGGEAKMRCKRDKLVGDRYIPQCTDTKCPGRCYRYWHTENAAANAWNRRANDAE